MALRVPPEPKPAVVRDGASSIRRGASDKMEQAPAAKVDGPARGSEQLRDEGVAHNEARRGARRAVDAGSASALFEQRALVGPGGTFKPLGLRLPSVPSVPSGAAPHAAAGVKKVDDAHATAPRRVGVFLGSFNPPHIGHRRTVERMKAEHGLDAVYVVPDRSTAYKKLEDIALREEMVKALFEAPLTDGKGVDGIRFLTDDMLRASSSGEMWDVLKAVNDAHPGAEVFNILGSDTLRWWATLPDDVRARSGGVTFLVNDRHDGEPLPAAIDGRSIHLVNDLDTGTSSTKVRQAIAGGRRPEELPSGVWDLIQAKKLYGAGP